MIASEAEQVEFSCNIKKDPPPPKFEIIFFNESCTMRLGSSIKKVNEGRFWFHVDLKHHKMTQRHPIKLLLYIGAFAF